MGFSLRVVSVFALFSAAAAALIPEQGQGVYTLEYEPLANTDPGQLERYYHQLDQVTQVVGGFLGRFQFCDVYSSFCSLVVQFESRQAANQVQTLSQSNAAWSNFGSLVSTSSETTGTVSRVYTNGAFVAEVGSLLTAFEYPLLSTVSDQAFFDTAFAAHNNLVANNPTYGALVLTKGEGTWRVVLHVTSASTTNATLFEEQFGTSLAPVVALLDAPQTGYIAGMLRFTQEWVKTWGAPQSFVLFESFLVNNGVSDAAFLASAASAERALRAENGYLGRNVLKAFNGSFVVQWAWETESDYTSSGVPTLDVIKLINSSTIVQSGYTVQTLFPPARSQFNLFATELPCGAPFLMRRFTRNEGVNNAQILDLSQALDEQRRSLSTNFTYTELLLNGDEYLEVGVQQREVGEAWSVELAVNPEIPVSLSGRNGSYSFETLEYLSGFWPSFDTQYSCASNFTVDPATTSVNITWVDATLRRAAPVHRVYLPAPGKHNVRVSLGTPKIAVFLTDYGRDPSEYEEFLSYQAELGYISIGLAYVNGIHIERLCIDDSDCFQSAWLRTIDGRSSAPPFVDIEAANSINDRLIALLTTLASGEPSTYGGYVVNGALQTDRILLAGSGQGASIAYAWNTVSPFAQVVAYDGPTDESSTGNAWLSSSISTPLSNVYAVQSSNNGACRTFQQNFGKIAGTGVYLNNTLCFSEGVLTAPDVDVRATRDLLYDFRAAWTKISGPNTCGIHYHSDALPEAVRRSGLSGKLYGCDGMGALRALFTDSDAFTTGACQTCNELDRRPVMSVSALGIDVGDCAVESPCRTLQYAIDRAANRTVIYIQRGTYAENVLIPESKEWLTLVGVTDSEGNPETVIRPNMINGNSNYGIAVHGQYTTISKLKIEFTTGLPTQEEIGIVFEATAHNSVIINCYFSRVGVTDPLGSRGAFANAGVQDIGVLDNTFRGSFQYGVHFEGTLCAALRNVIRSATDVGVLVGASAKTNSVAGNVIRDVNGDGISVHGESNLVYGNYVWRNFGRGIVVGVAGLENIVSLNRIYWNQMGYVRNEGTNTSITCYSNAGVPSIYNSSDCTHHTLRVTSSGNDATCMPNSNTLKCRTITGALARASPGYTILLEDMEYAEEVAINVTGTYLVGDQLGTRNIIRAVTATGVSVEASQFRMEQIHVILPSTNPSGVEIGIHVTSEYAHAYIEDCRVERTATTSHPASIGVLLQGVESLFAESTITGSFFDSLIDISQGHTDIYENTIAGALRNCMMLGNVDVAVEYGSTYTFYMEKGASVRDNVISSCGKDGIQIQSMNNVVQDNSVTYAASVGIHICGQASAVTGPGGPCDAGFHTTLSVLSSSQIFIAGNTVRRNRLTKSLKDFVDDITVSNGDDILMQVPVYDNFGILDPSQVLSMVWINIGPYTAIVGGTVPLQAYGFWDRSQPLHAKLAAGRDSCYGYAPVAAGGLEEGMVTDDRSLAFVGPISTVGNYRVCIKYRLDWEETSTIVSIVDQDVNKAYYGAPSCQGAMEATGSVHCGCYYKRGVTDQKYVVADPIPLTSLTSGSNAIYIAQGCCMRNTSTTMEFPIDATTSWGMCSNA